MANESKLMRKAIHFLFAWLVAALLAGCSQNSGGVLETTGTDSQVLTFPLTITITTPSPVSPLTPVIGGSNLVNLGARAEIVQGMTVSMGSGGLLTQPDALLNETWSRGTAALNDRVNVRGTLHARNRSNGNNVLVTTWDQNPALDPVQALSWQVNYPSGPANDVTLNSGNALSLDPGKYGVVTLNSQSTLTLSTGTYFLTSFSIQSASVIKLNQSRGPIIVYVTDALPLRGTFVPLSGTDPDLLIAYLGTTPVTVETLFNGAVLAPSTSLTLRSVNATHQGFYYAKDMILDAGAKVKFRAPNAIIGAAKPPASSCRKLAATVPPDKLFKYCKGCEIPIDSDRDGFEDCVDGCMFDPAKSEPGLCGCGNPETDTDHDGTPDCLDPCDLDANNVTPGECGCSSSDPDLKKPVPSGTRCTNRGCPATGTLTCNGAGVCGNLSGCNPGGCRFVESNQSSYWFCPGPATEAQAMQQCRNRQMALVRIEGFLENDFLKHLVTKPVWIGANSVTTSGTWRWTTPTSNDGDQLWSGGATGSQKNALFSFWAQGAPASQRCAVIQPGDARWRDVDCNEGLGFICEFRTPVTPPGPNTYPPIGGGGPAPVPNPMPSTCITSAAAFLPASPIPPYDAKDPAHDLGIDQFLAAQNAAKTGMFMGPAQMPPLHNTGNCAEALELPAGIGTDADATGRGCRFDRISNEPAGFNCKQDSECTPFGAGLECREVKDPTCVPTDDPKTLCGLKPHCGRVVCPPVQIQTDDPTRIDACQTIDVCDPGDDATDNSMGDTLTPSQFDPRGMFGGALPAVQSFPYDDTPEPEFIPTKDHKWCFMDANRPIPDADQAPDNKEGRSNGGSKISFNFDPNVSFHAKANLLSMGETDLDADARATLSTKVTLNGFIGVDYGPSEILNAQADIHAHRCTIDTKDTHFTVFGIDFIQLAGVPLFDTNDKDHDCLIPDSTGSCKNKFRFHPLTERCEATVGKFLTAANRAKKAFRDVQQLVQQFKVIKKANPLGTLTDLCQNVIGVLGDDGAVDVPGFPDGLACPENEPAEVTINRFIDYYQAPGTGQISQLKETIGEVRDATNAFFNGLNKTVEFGPEPKNESKTLVEAQFQIGPVPCVLEIAAFYSYGVHGFFEIGLKPPFNPFDDIPATGIERNPIALVKAGVAPFASAGLSAFVGAGKSLGPFSATLGIEGRVTLADVRAPIFAGAGIGAEVRVDQRSLAPDIEETLGALGLDDVPTHLGVPKSFKFFVWYEYGAAITVDKILAGEVNGRLRIKFAFFSRTWRKRIVKFNGLNGFKINIVSGKFGTDPTQAQDADQVNFLGVDKAPATESATINAGTADMGLSESQVPLLKMDSLEVPTETPDPDATGNQEFHADQVGAMFYDNLCCSKKGEPCLQEGEHPARFSGKAPCCPGSFCRDTASAGTFVCEVDCRDPGGRCTTVDDCCQASSFTTTCESAQCTRCGNVAPNNMGGACTQRDDCCGAANDPLIQCVTGHCAPTCLPTGSACANDTECCTDAHFECGVASHQCCGHSRFGNTDPIPAASCTQTSDCCGAGQPGIRCNNGLCEATVP